MNDVAEINARLADSKAPHANHIIDQLRLAISEAISLAARNAVTEQSQFAITVQAAATQSVAQILTRLDVAAETAASSVATENPAAIPPNTLNERAAGKVVANSTGMDAPDFRAMSNEQDEEFSKAFDALLASFNRALNTIALNQLSVANALVKQSLQTAIVLKMIESPENFDAYVKILDRVSTL
jgi:hypothetical protein